MNTKFLSTAIALVAVTQLAAQTATPVVRYMIKSKSDLKTDAKVLVDGEEMEGVGRMGAGMLGGNGATTSTFVYDEGKTDGGTWRKYHTAEALVAGEGRDGAPTESTVKSALTGKKVFFTTKDGKVTASENDAAGTKLDEQTIRDVPLATDLNGLLPAGDLVADAKVELNAPFRAAIKSLVHPVRAAQPPQGEQGGDAPPRPRGEGQEPGAPGQGEGQGQGQGEGRGRGQGQGQGRRRGQFGGGRGGNNPALSLLTNDKLTWTGGGKVASIEEKDGKKIARIEFSGTIQGDGDLRELGLMPNQMGGGRRGGGGGGGQQQGPAGKGKADVKINGEIFVDAQTRQIQKLTLNGDVAQTIDSTMMRPGRDGGEESEIETHADTKGKLTVEVTTELRPAGE